MFLFANSTFFVYNLIIIIFQIAVLVIYKRISARLDLNVVRDSYYFQFFNINSISD